MKSTVIASVDERKREECFPPASLTFASRKEKARKRCARCIYTAGNISRERRERCSRSKTSSERTTREKNVPRYLIEELFFDSSAPLLRRKLLLFFLFFAVIFSVIGSLLFFPTSHLSGDPR